MLHINVNGHKQSKSLFEHVVSQGVTGLDETSWKVKAFFLMAEFSGEKLACEETFLLLYTLQKWKFKGKQKFFWGRLIV